jgi:hypothetical protein
MRLKMDRNRGHNNPNPLHPSSVTIKKGIFAIIFVFTTFACQFPIVQENPPDDSNTLSQPTPNPIFLAEILFWVEIPENTPPSETIQLVILDEVTGLPFNQNRMDMIQVDSTHYGVAVQAKLGTIIKYRYEHLCVTVCT